MNSLVAAINILAASSEVFVMAAYAGIQFLDSGFRRNDDASVGVLDPIENKLLNVLYKSFLSNLVHHYAKGNSSKRKSSGDATSPVNSLSTIVECIFLYRNK
ncbi:MAG: hypothetical protein V1799_19250 [bacterium]